MVGSARGGKGGEAASAERGEGWWGGVVGLERALVGWNVGLSFLGCVPAFG